MDTKKKKGKRQQIGMALICVIAIGISGFNIFSTTHLRQTAAMIYEHPYAVSNESRAMRSRLLDMKSFLLNLVSDPATGIDEVRQILNGRYAMQYDSIETITR